MEAHGHFTINQEIHRYNTRNKGEGDFNISKRISKFDSVFISGHKIWNSLQNNLNKLKA